MDNTARLTELLKSRKLKATPKRVELLSAIDDYDSAIPYSKLQTALQKFDRVTLYRTLNTLLEKGIIHKASVEGTETYYAMCSTHTCSSHAHHHEHIHFKCTNCKTVSCVQVAQPLNIKIPNFVIKNLEVNATGL